MKKIISIMAACALALSMSVTAFATEVKPDANGDPDPDSGNTAVSLNVDSGYIITIPETVELEEQSGAKTTYENDLTVSADAGVRINEGKSIVVSMASSSYDSGSFYMTAAGADQYKLAYEVTVDNSTIANNGTVATFVTSDAAQTSTLHFAADDPTYAGSYSDTVTFTIAVQ
ncbi:MAG: hypothetical protein LUF33_05550 [Clostridiales bacterium]|nr:hypothetical protein [Clostridiales bacterium]